MKSIFVSFTFILISLMSYSSDNREVRNLNDFDEIKIIGNVKAILVPSDSTYIELTAGYFDLGKVSTSVDRGMLIVSNTTLGEDKEVAAKIYYKKIELLIATTACNVYIKDTLKADFFEIESRSGAIVHAALDVKKLKLIVGTGCDLFASGSAEYADVELKNSARFYGEHLKVDEMKIDASLSSLAEVNVVKYLDAFATMDSKILYVKEPEKISQTTRLGSYIGKK